MKRSPGYTGKHPSPISIRGELERGEWGNLGEVTSPPAPFSLRYISWSFLAKSSNTCVDILHQGEEREREREREERWGRYKRREQG